MPLPLCYHSRTLCSSRKWPRQSSGIPAVRATCGVWWQLATEAYRVSASWKFKLQRSTGYPDGVALEAQLHVRSMSARLNFLLYKYIYNNWANGRETGQTAADGTTCEQCVCSCSDRDAEAPGGEPSEMSQRLHMTESTCIRERRRSTSLRLSLESRSSPRRV